eukprot:16980-Pleurochrysis_carterae.AAC.2
MYYTPPPPRHTDWQPCHAPRPIKCHTRAPSAPQPFARVRTREVALRLALRLERVHLALLRLDVQPAHHRLPRPHNRRAGERQCACAWVRVRVHAFECVRVCARALEVGARA